jgi:serine/threonine protein kinase
MHARRLLFFPATILLHAGVRVQQLPPHGVPQRRAFDRFAESRWVTLSLRRKWFLLFHLVHGVRFLVSREIVHLDLKPANVLVCQQLIPKTVDFGSAYHRELCPKGTISLI